MPVGRLTSVRPLWGIEGGRVTLEGDGFAIDPVAPQVRVGVQPAHLAAASGTTLTLLMFGCERTSFSASSGRLSWSSMSASISRAGISVSPLPSLSCLSATERISRNASSGFPSAKARHAADSF